MMDKWMYVWMDGQGNAKIKPFLSLLIDLEAFPTSRFKSRRDQKRMVLDNMTEFPCDAITDESSGTRITCSNELKWMKDGREFCI